MQTTEEKVDTSKAFDASSVDTKCSRTESKELDTSSRLRNDAHDDGADIKPIYDEEPMAEVQTTAEIEVFAIGQQHTEQPEFNNEGEVVQNAEECHDTCPLPAIFTDNQIPKHSYQSLESKNSCLKKAVAQFRKDFSRLEAHCVNLELKYQNQVLNKGRQSQFLKVKITTHYLPKEREAASAKPHHMIASKNFKISSKNMTRFSSNDMVYNHYLEEAKKKIQEYNTNSEPSLMHSARSKSTANGSKPRPRRNTQTYRIWPASKNSFVTTKTVPIAENSKNSRNFSDSKHFVCSTCQKCVFSANHDSCVTKFLKEVNSRAKVPSNKTTNKNKPVEQINVPNKQERQIPIGHRFSIQKTFIVQKKTMNPRSCLRWKSTGKIFKIVSLRWVPTGRIFTSSTTKVDNEPRNGSNADISNQYKCEHTLDVSAELKIHDHSNEPSSSKLVPNVIPPACKTATSQQELELLFHHHLTMLMSTFLRYDGDECDKGRMPTKIELTLEQSQQGVGNDVLSWHTIARWQRRSRQKDKDLKISDEKTKSKDQRSQSMKEQAYNINRDED
nr:hypothetical protein [Tanacetum cinerariifolium]